MTLERKLCAVFVVLVLCGSSTPSSFLIGKINPSSSVQPSYVTVNGDFVRIGNSYLEIVITLGNNTGGGIYSIVDKQSGVDFIKNKSAVTISFWLRYWSSLLSEYEAMIPHAQNMSYRYAASSAGAWLNFTWAGLSSTEEGKSFDATVNVGIDLPTNSSLSYWYLDIENRDPTVIEDIIFPNIQGVGQISDPSHGDYLVNPDWSGELFKNPALNFKPQSGGLGEVFYPSSGSQDMQFIAYYSTQPNAGLYLASLDRTGSFVKSMMVDTNGSPLSLKIHHIPDFTPALHLHLPYPVAIGVFHGDWYDAAQLYKSWAVKQSWLSQGTIANRTNVPDWLKHSGIVADVLTHCPGTYYVQQIAEAMSHFYGTTPTLWWRGWEHDGWGVGNTIFPPAQGWPGFISAANGTHAGGGRIEIDEVSGSDVVNGSGWYLAKNHAPVGRNGSYYYSNWAGGVDRSCNQVFQYKAVMNPDSFWNSFVSNMTITAAANGVDMLELDGSVGPPKLNYNTSEPHVGGGTYWVSGWTSILSNLRDEAKNINPNFALASEWFGEQYIPYLDSTRDSVNGLNPLGICGGGCYNDSLNAYIPLWQSVYHEYQLQYAQEAIIDGRDMLFYQWELTIPLVWGDTPEVTMDTGNGPPYNLQLYSPAMLNYSARIAQARATYAYSYLVEGAMLRPIQLTGAPWITIPSVTNQVYEGGTFPPFKTQGAVGSAWRANDGSTGVVLTSIMNQSTSVNLSLNGLGLGYGTGYVAYTVRNGNFSLLSSSFAPTGNLSIRLQPLDVYFLALSNSSGQRGQGAISLNGVISSVQLVEEQGYNLGSAKALLGNATQAFYSGNYSEEKSIINAIQADLRQAQQVAVTATQTLTQSSTTTVTNFPTSITTATTKETSTEAVSRFSIVTSLAVACGLIGGLAVSVILWLRLRRTLG